MNSTTDSLPTYEQVMREDSLIQKDHDAKFNCKESFLVLLGIVLFGFLIFCFVFFLNKNEL